MDRRSFLTLVGGGAVLSACAEGADPATAWRSPGQTEVDPRRRALAWGILAPNPHNMQPWLVDLRTPEEATLYVHPARLLPQTDPFNRQIVIGCGAFCELTRMAAAREGWEIEIALFPLGEPEPRVDKRPIARMRFTRAASVVDPLFPAAIDRRTNRSPFTERRVSERDAQAIASAASGAATLASATVEPSRTRTLQSLVFKGARTESFTLAAHKESIERTFFGAADIAAHPYGVSARGAKVEVLNALGMLNRSDMERPGSLGFNAELDVLRSAADTARGFLWLTTPGNSRHEQFAAGAAYLRANLQATLLGIAMHPWSQCLQEYSSMSPVLHAVHTALAPNGGRVQMLARLGYAPPTPPAPKRGLDAQILRS